MVLSMSSYYVVGVVAFVGVLWLLVALPQRRINRRHAEIVAGLELGDRVMTAGGFHGLVRELAEDTVRLEIAPETVVTLARGAVAAVLTPSQESGTGADMDSGRRSSS
jgi:preprotein translocase subunit YajC